MLYGEDTTYAIVILDGLDRHERLSGCLFVSWYKRRGRTPNIRIEDVFKRTKIPNLQEFNLIVDCLKENK